MWTRYISLPPTLHRWEHSHIDTPGSRAGWIVYTLSLWKQRGADSGGERWSHLLASHSSNAPASSAFLPLPGCAHPTHPPKHSLPKTPKCSALSRSSKFWLLSVYNRLFGDLFIYKRLWTTYVPPGIVLDAGHVMAASSPTPRAGSFPLLRRVPSPNFTVNKESFVYEEVSNVMASEPMLSSRALLADKRREKILRCIVECMRTGTVLVLDSALSPVPVTGSGTK